MYVLGMRVVDVVLAVTCLGSSQALTLIPPCLLKFDNRSSINLILTKMMILIPHQSLLHLPTNTSVPLEDCRTVG
ncbi:hypothetical protein E2C01_053571 [Portunus trituberculatus]|uniref:Secreted protein n=1 Tax=Portunus trituberculatus TaxID=210409 RepID=A0A5B7GQN4_PORTR|nr:hypothetical protein [Portunus trituberculatus]